MATMLLELPRPLAITIISELLDERSVSRLDSAICSVSRRTRFLEFLSCDECTLQGNKLINQQFIKGKSMKETYMRWCISRNVKITAFTWTTDCQLNEENVLARFIGLICQRLHKLTVKGVNVKPQLQTLGLLKFEHLVEFHWDQQHEGCDGLAVLLSCMPRLQTLSLYCNHAPEDGLFASLNLANLRHLSVVGEVEVRELELLARASPNVVALMYSPHVMQQDSTNVFSFLPCLQKLVYDACVADAEVMCIADHCSALTQIQLENARGLTDAGVVYLCSKCQHINILYIRRSNQITSASLHHISAYLLKTLTQLVLSFCIRVLSDLHEASFPKLQVLDIHCSGTFSEHDEPHRLDLLFLGCPAVRKVCLDYCWINDALLEALATHCVHIQELSITGCVGFTLAGLTAQLMRLPELCFLQINAESYSGELQALLEARDCEVLLRQQYAVEGDNDDGDELASDDGGGELSEDSDS